MRKNFNKIHLPELVFSSSDSYTSQQLTKLVRGGKLRKILPRVYTSNILEDDEIIVQRNLWLLLSHSFPQAILSHRSAIEFSASPLNNIYLTGKDRRVRNWPGITVRMTIGPTPLEDDQPLYENFYASSLERALLENLLKSRTVKGEKRVLSQGKIEERLLVELNARGEKGLNKIRDRARKISLKFGWEQAFFKLNKMISAILSSQPAAILKSPLAIARAFGEPYDPHRMELFQQLIGALKNNSFEERPEKIINASSFKLIAFFESYFSNYIEGTVFEIEEARDIIYNNKIILNRNEDSHDVRATYKLVSDRNEMNQIPASPEDFILFLKKRHSIILAGRVQKNPGIFKTRANRAGGSHFVMPEQVIGTLKNGFKLINALAHPFERALFMMFLVSEVHPFDDGNGRLARIMMNAELVHGQQSKLIIPTVYREDYIINLKKITQQRTPIAYIRMMKRVYAFSHWLTPDNFDSIQEQLERSNAFKESREAVLQF